MNEGTKSVNVRDYYNNRYKEGFQKGKLEREREILKLMDNIEIEFPDDDGTPFCINGFEFKEQLKKEIGGMK